jgi:hypothetical protein
MNHLSQGGNSRMLGLYLGDIVGCCALGVFLLFTSPVVPASVVPFDLI